MKNYKAQRNKEGSKTPTRVYSKTQENYVAQRFNGSRQLNSGATPFAKGDVLLDNWLIECKTKTEDSKSISIKKDWIDKNNQEALFMGKPYSALAINFGPNSKNYYVISEELFEYLVNFVNGDFNEESN